MAREFARLLVSIWDDKDWIALTSQQQIIYLAMASSPDLSWCGLLPMTPARLSALSSDLSEPKVRACITALVRAHFVIVDRKTAEVLVRTYVRHDGILKQPNVTKAMVRALGKVHSQALIGAIKAELGRELSENPEAKGWAAVRSESPELFQELLATPSRNPFRNPSENPSENTSRKGCPTTLPPSPNHRKIPVASKSKSSSSVTREAATIGLANAI